MASQYYHIDRYGRTAMIPIWNYGYGPHSLTYKCRALEEKVYIHEGQPWTHESRPPAVRSMEHYHTQFKFVAQSYPHAGRRFLVARCNPPACHESMNPTPECTTLFRRCEPDELPKRPHYLPKLKDGCFLDPVTRYDGGTYNPADNCGNCGQTTGDPK